METTGCKTRVCLILQPHLLFASLVVCAAGTGLMSSAPPGPGQHQAGLDGSGPRQSDQEPADLWDGEREQAELAGQAAASPFARPPVASVRVITRKAWASRAR